MITDETLKNTDFTFQKISNHVNTKNLDTRTEQIVKLKIDLRKCR